MTYIESIKFLLGNKSKRLLPLVIIFLLSSLIDLLGIGLIGGYIAIILDPLFITKIQEILPIISFLNNFNHDVPFYLEMAKSFGEKTLELACGTGRITLPLAKQGIDIVGIDISNGMISEAKEKAQKQNLNVE